MFRLGLGLLLFGGCGLVSSNAADVSLDLPPKPFSIDTSGWQVTQDAATAYLATTCTPSTTTAMDVCAAAATAACPMNCSGSCDASAHTCDLALQIAAHQMVDLLTEEPSLESLASHSDVTVTVDSVQYEVVDNTLSIATPPITVYVAPMSATLPTDSGVTAIASIEPVAAKAVVATENLSFLDGGQAALTAAMSDFKDPFNVIVGATITLAAGDPLPTGKLDATVQINAHASP
jgi:hypothetical protein